MFRNIFVVVLLAASLAACNKRSPTAPSENTPPPPDQSRYEALPAVHQLADANGQKVDAWATLQSVSPLRGSTVRLGPPCNDGCFTHSMRVRIDSLGSAPGVWSPNPVLRYQLYFSDDGVNPRPDSPYLGGGHLNAVDNRTEETIGGTVTPFLYAPRFLLLAGEYSRNVQGAGSTTVQVRTAFELDYK